MTSNSSLPGCLRLASSLFSWTSSPLLLLLRQTNVGNPCGRRVVGAPSLLYLARKKKEATDGSKPSSLSLSFPLAAAGRPGQQGTKRALLNTGRGRQRPLHPGRKGASSLEKGGLSCLPLVPTTKRSICAAAAWEKWGRKGRFMVGGRHRKLCREERKGTGVWGSAAV